MFVPQLGSALIQRVTGRHCATACVAQHGHLDTAAVVGEGAAGGGLTAVGISPGARLEQSTCITS